MSQSILKNAQDQSRLEIIEFFIDELQDDGTAYRSFFGMNVAKVIEIIRLPSYTAMPGRSHHAAMGTFALRDKVLPLVDLALWLNKKLVPDKTRKVIVCEFAGVVTAFIVSGVTRIHRMTWAQIEPPGKYLQAFSQDCVTGVLRHENRILFLLDMEFIVGTMDPRLKLDRHTAQLGNIQGTGAGLHVLVVDDSTSVRNTIAFYLEREEYRITKAGSGLEGWKLLEQWAMQARENSESVTKYVNLVISDIEMPEMDGHSLTMKIRSDPAFSSVPVILFSSIISDMQRVKGERAGADDQIGKPDLPALAQRTRALIDTFSAKTR